MKIEVKREEKSYLGISAIRPLQVFYKKSLTLGSTLTRAPSLRDERQGREGGKMKRRKEMERKGVGLLLFGRPKERKGEEEKEKEKRCCGAATEMGGGGKRRKRKREGRGNVRLLRA